VPRRLNTVDDRESTTGDDLAAVKGLPKEFGVLLIVLGLGGLMVPGPVGSPLVLLGGVILWPRAFRGVEARFREKFPETHRRSVAQVKRFVSDLDRRYPRRTARP
jgi:hypothetical protein